MKRPVLLFGLALIFWGLMTGNLALAVIIGLILEVPNVISKRYEFSDKDFNRIGDLTTFIFLLFTVYIFVSSRSVDGLFTLIEWFPLIFLPIVGAQLYSTREKIGVNSIFFIFRKREYDTAVDLSYPYLIICILSAGAANQRTIWFYVGISLLTAFALWFERSKRFSPLTWIVLLLVILFSGYLGQMGLHALHGKVEKSIIRQLTGKSADPYKSNTRMGTIGKLKTSGAIALRVDKKDKKNLPKLLMEASYNIYNYTTWMASGNVFDHLTPGLDKGSWRLSDSDSNKDAFSISMYLKGGNGVLPLPMGTSMIEELPALSMQRNKMGTVKVEDAPRLVNYHVNISGGISNYPPPTRVDLLVSAMERPLIKKIATELGLYEKTPKEVLDTISTYLSKDFQYSLELSRQNTDTTALSDFLLRSRSGHCEFFATATVLLLREAGLPARYAVGYSVQEFSDFEGVYIVRERDAHAWTLVYIDGRWTNFDTTPSSWYEIDKQGASVLEPLTDLLSRGFLFVYKLELSRWQAKMSKFIFAIIIVFIAVVLAWKMFFKKNMTRSKKIKKKTQVAISKSGTDSYFYRVELRLLELGYKRHSSEPISKWIERIGDAPHGVSITNGIAPLLEVHYRYRFDPRGLSDEEKRGLKNGVDKWLRETKKEEAEV